jgi:hypothetical protein
MFPSDFGKSGRLDRLYICRECKVAYLFKSDIEEHFAVSGHKELAVLPLDQLDKN